MKLPGTRYRKILASILPLFLCVFFFYGCGETGRLQGMELSRRLLIEAIGLDADEKGVVLSLLTMQTKPSWGQTEEGQDSEQNRFLRFTAGTVGQAAAMAQRSTGQIPYFAHARLLVIGKSAAKQGVSAFFDFFLRNRAVRSRIPVCVAAGDASDVLASAIAPSQGCAAQLEQILSASHASGKSALTPLFSFLNRLFSDDTEAFCPILEVTDAQNEESVSVNGTAVFSGERLQSELTEDETTALLLLMDALPEALIPLEERTPPATCRVRETAAHYKKVKNVASAFDLTLHIRAELTEADGSRYPVDDQTKEQLADALRETLTHSVLNCFQKLYREEGADLCRLRRKLHTEQSFPDKKIQLRLRVFVSLN